MAEQKVDWTKANWHKSDSELAKELGCSKQNVWTKRRNRMKEKIALQIGYKALKRGEVSERCEHSYITIATSTTATKYKPSRISSGDPEEIDRTTNCTLWLMCTKCYDKVHTGIDNKDLLP